LLLFYLAGFFCKIDLKLVIISSSPHLLTDLLITRLLMLILYFKIFHLLNLVPFRSMVRGSWPISGHPRPRSLIHGLRTRMPTDKSRASNQRSSTRSPRGFFRRAGSSTRSRQGFSRIAKTRTRTRRGFSRRAKTRTRTRRVVLSPRQQLCLAPSKNTKIEPCDRHNFIHCVSLPCG
jgi:hypothetical protein